MRKIKIYFKKIKGFFVKKPKLLIPTVAVIAFVIFGVFECVRARIYINSAGDYKNSVEVLALKDTVNLLNRSVELSPPAIYCDISYEGLLPEFNEAYTPLINDDNQPETVVAKLNSQVNSVAPAPAFSSLMEFLPRPKEARQTSVEMHSALIELNNLTTPDVRGDYCIELANALKRSYFLHDLQKPETVSALFVGQLENFQVNITQSLDLLKTMKIPDMFSAEHIQIIETLQKAAVDLRKNQYNTKVFSASIEEDVKQLDEILQNIKSKTTDLQTRPQQITLQTGYLK